MTAVELLDVALHGPLEVRLAGRGAGGAASAEAAAEDDRRRRGTGGDGNGHGDGGHQGIGGVAVARFDDNGIGVLDSGVERGPGGDGDLAGVLHDLELRRPGQPVGENGTVDIPGGDGSADVGPRRCRLDDRAFSGRRRERRRVVHGADGDRDRAHEGRAIAVGDRVGEGVCAVIVDFGRVGDRPGDGVYRRATVFGACCTLTVRSACRGLGVAIVREDIDDDGLILVGRGGVVFHYRGLVHVCDGDGDVNGAGSTREAVVGFHK